ncbi:MAG: flagellar basal-body rod protein FlgF [Nitrospirae bacterium]|nr:flagellar basal-body rod protein FlgF [Nitrospirota bacterium]
MDALYPVLSGALTQEKNLEVITNNLANLNSSGFKKDFPILSALDPLGFDQPNLNGGKDPLPTYGFLDGISTDFSPGVIKQTGEPLDVAIDGENFLSVQTPAGVRYTRNGSLSLNSEGQIVTQSGYPVLGSSGPITLPPGRVNIDDEGRVSVEGIEIDSFQLVQFGDLKSLKKMEGTLFEAFGVTATPAIEKRVQQGFLEGSNVNPVEEMVAMIRIMRLYEASQKVIQSTDEMASKASNDLGKV